LPPWTTEQADMAGGKYAARRDQRRIPCILGLISAADSRNSDEFGQDRLNTEQYIVMNSPYRAEHAASLASPRRGQWPQRNRIEHVALPNNARPW